MKGFFIEVSNNLLDPQHCKQLGEAVWLFMWLIDKITVITAQEKGKVLGNKPIRYEDIKTDLGISRSTYGRWMDVLEDNGYITTLRTPYGKCIVVLKAKKRFNKSVPIDDSKMTHLITSVKNETSGCVKNDASVSINDTSHTQKRHISHPDMTHVIKTIAVDNTEDNSKKILAPSAQNDLNGDKNLPISFQEKVSKYETGEKKITYDMVNEAIASFLPLFPSKFVGKQKPFAIPTTRDIIKMTLLVYTMGELKELINKYLEKREEKFIPQASNIFAFCSKVDAIETYLNKNNGLWAQRSISTPEQRADSDELIKKRIEVDREQQRKDKEEWERTHSK